MAIFNSLEFDGINSLDYGFYISGDPVYNAPERAMEMVSIPGRNGALALDYGRYENIQVSYPVGVFAVDQAELADKLRRFRNELVSRFRYCKLTDTYHPDEYRIALYKSGLEAAPTAALRGAEFSITFECKPQRYLLTGEEPIEITYEPDYLTDHNLEAIETHSGAKIETGYQDGTFESPTLFGSRPIIKVPSAGGINLNGSVIGIGGDGSTPIYIDTDVGAIYTEDEEGRKKNAANLVSFESGLVPELVPGENSIETNIDGVELTPKWWIL